MAPSLGELDVDHPALPPASPSIELAIPVEHARHGTIPITHYRVLSKQQPALLRLGPWHCASARGRASEIRPAQMQSWGQRRAATIGVIQMSQT